MDAPTIPVSVDSSEGNFGDAPAAADAFPTVTIVAILASLGEAIRGIHEYLQGVPIWTMEAIETVTRSQERRTRREVEQQLASIQKSQRQDRENFRKLQELELALLCVRMFPEESDKIERYVGGLPDMIHGNIVASKPKTMQEAVEMATELMDKKVSTIAERQAENKRKFENTSRNNQNQQQQNKRQNTGRAYTAGSLQQGW
ncbi:hypothetical protein Tco_0968911 [Tanacetum coccineum]